MKQFQLKKGSSFQDRNIVSLEAKFRALQLVSEGKSSKEALEIIAQEYNLDSMKSSWTRYAGSTISRFRADIQNKISQDNPDALRLAEKYAKVWNEIEEFEQRARQREQARRELRGAV